MFQRIFYFLDNKLKKLQAPNPLIKKNETVSIFHRSTFDHLKILLEDLLHSTPEISINIYLSSSTDDLYKNLPNARLFEKTFNIKFISYEDFKKANSPSDISDISILLYSEKAKSPKKNLKELKKRFAVCPSKQKIIIDGDGSVWKGDLKSRILRRFLRTLIKYIKPLCEKEEKKLIEKRLIDESEIRGSQQNENNKNKKKNKVILSLPTLILQDLETGNIIKPNLISESENYEIYEEGYHFKKYFDVQLDWDARLKEYQNRRWRNILRVGSEYLKDFDNKEKTAIDIGCGTGGLTEKLSKEGFKTIGIDCSVSAIQKAKESFPSLEFKVMKFEELKNLNQKYDFIVLSHVLEHVNDDKEFLKSLKNIMHNKSLLYIEVPWFSKILMKQRPYWYRQSDHCREYSKIGLSKIVSESGYKILDHYDSLNEEGNEPFQFLVAKLP